jgi:iduronate 2-sulfatase
MKVLFLLLASELCLWGATAPNVLLLCVDDLRPELGCYGVEHARTPHIDRLAAQGRVFQRHYVQAPTCGASRYALLTGLYGPRGNDALMQRARQTDARRPSLPEAFRAAGYTTVAVGKVSHHPGGRGGERWSDEQMQEMPGAWDRQPLPCGAWKDAEGLMHGLAHGATRGKSPYPVFQTEEGPDTIYPDGLITEAALGELKLLAKQSKPFFLAVGWIRPHLPFGCPHKWYDLHAATELPPILHPNRPRGVTTWHNSGEFMRYDRGGRDPRKDPEYADRVRRHYAASVSYADAQVGRLMAELDARNLHDRTIVILWGDHGWHLGEHGVWGKHTLFEESLRSPLIVRYPGIPHAGESNESVVSTVDLFPTLCDLAGIAAPDFLHGTSLKEALNHPGHAGGQAVSYFAGAETLRTPRHRLIRHHAKQGKPACFELYDHASPEGETLNRADREKELVTELARRLDSEYSKIHRR